MSTINRKELRKTVHKRIRKKVAGTPARPRLAVLALNPHCGEGGLFGDQERTVIAPATFRSSQVTGELSFLNATTTLDIRLRRSLKEVVRARMAIISLATVMSKPVSRSTPFSPPPRPILTFLKDRSLTSTTLRHNILPVSMPSLFFLKRWLSKKAAQRL